MRSARILGIGSACLLCVIGFAQAQNSPVPAPQAPPVRSILPAFHASTEPVNNPVTPNFPTLVFDAETKEYDPNPSEMIAPFTFHLTNVWTNEIVITQVHPSCGCTTAKLPATPWHIPPGGSGEVGAQVSLAGKPPGMVAKTLTFFTSVGNRVVTLKVNIPPLGAAMATLSQDARKAAMARATADPKAIFRGECASCHVDKGANAFAQDLYAADCGICHESSHRDSAVPDLHALKQPTDLDYWKAIITFGKPHTMMPAFARTQGGPLNDAQVSSLAAYLDRTVSHHFQSRPGDKASAGNSPSGTGHF
jgi:mono/diheme cytochrome c family protein